MCALACADGPTGRAHVCGHPALLRALPARTTRSRGARRIVPEPDSIAAVWSDMRAIADALGVPERGVQLVTRVRARLRAIADRVGSLAPARVAVLGSLAPPRAVRGWLPELLALAGATDVLAGAELDGVAVTPTLLLAADPDAIFVAPRGLDLAAAIVAVRARGPRVPWRSTRAWREGRVFVADGATCFHRAGPRIAETLEVVAEALHPEAFRFGHAGREWEPLGR